MAIVTEEVRHLIDHVLSCEGIKLFRVEVEGVVVQIQEREATPYHLTPTAWKLKLPDASDEPEARIETPWLEGKRPPVEEDAMELAMRLSSERTQDKGVEE